MLSFAAMSCIPMGLLAGDKNSICQGQGLVVGDYDEPSQPYQNKEALSATAEASSRLANGGSL